MKKRSTSASQDTNKYNQINEQTLEINARNLQQLFDTMASGFALHDIICDELGKPVDYRFLQMNPAFEKQTGLVARDVLGKTALEVIPGLEPFWIETFGRVALTGEPESFENYSGPLNRIFSVVAYSPQRGQFAVLFEDITERRLAEKLLTRRNEDLDLLNAVNAALNNGESLEKIFDLISERVKIIFNCFGATINLVNADRTRLVMQNLVIQSWLVKSIEKLTGIHIPPVLEHDLQSAHPYRPVLNTGKSQLINDPEGIQNFMEGYLLCLKVPEKTHTRLAGLIPAIYKLINRRSIMVVPLLSNDVVIGTLDVGSSDPFSQEDLLRLEAIAGSLTTVILRKRAEEKLITSEGKYRSLFNSMTEGVAINELVMDENGIVVDYIILEVNAAFEINTPYKASEVLGKRATEIYQMSTEYITSWWQQHVEMGQTAFTELYHEPSKRWHAITTTHPVNQRFYTIFTDITERKLVLNSLEETNASLSLALEAGNAGTYDWDIVNNTFNWSSEFLKIFGLPADTVPGFEAWRKAVHPEDVEAAAAHIQESIDHHVELVNNYRIILPTGEVRHIRATGKTYYDADKPLRMAGLCMDITPLVQAEQKLQESAGNIQAILDSNLDSVFLIEPDGTILAANLGLADKFNRNRDELIGSNVYELLDKNVADHRRKFIEQVITSGKPIRFEDERSGITIENSIYPVLDEKGKVIRLAIFGRDVSDRSKVDELIRRSETELKKAQSYAHVGNWIWNINSGMLEWSDEMYKIFGISKDNFSGNLAEVVANAIHPDDRQKVEESNSSVANEGKPVPLEYRIMRPDGNQRVVWAEAGELELDDEGKPALLRGIVMDITDRKQAEEALQESEEKFRILNMLAPAGIYMTDTEGNCLYTNLRWNEMAGIRPQDALGKGWINGLHPEDRNAVISNWEKMVESEGSWGLEYRFLTPEGKVTWVHGLATPQKDNSGKTIGFVGLNMDITMRKQAEEDLMESERRYRERVNELETIMDIAPVALWIAQDPACHVIVGNRTANELHRIQQNQNPSLTPASDLKFKPDHLKIFHDGVEITVNDLPLQVCASKGINIINYESQIVFEDGSVIHEIGNAKPLFDENGQPRGAVGAFMNITGLKQVEEELRRRAEELDALQKTVFEITAAQSLPGLLESIVERACQLVGAPSGGLYLADPVKQEVRCDVSYKTPADYVGVILKYGEGISGRVAQTGQPLMVNDYKNWAGRAQSFEVDRPFSTVLGVPLLWGGQVRGVIDVLHYEDGKSFSQADMDLLNIFAGHAAIVIENSRLLEASQADQAQVRELSTRLAEAEENERRRIARELHDQVGQSLSALSINMNIMHSQVPEFLPGFKRRLDDSLMLIDQTTDHIRHLMSELRPAVLDDYGLKAALDWAVGSIAKRTNLKLLVEGECNRFPPRVEIALFRIAQEALGNITRHAHARVVKIQLRQDGPEMSMSITDDGVGFDPSNIAATEKSGWGLRLMAERAESISANLQIDSTPGKGTCITARYQDENPAGR